MSADTHPTPRSSKEWERHYENMRTRLLEDWARTANEWERHYEIMRLRAERAEARLQELEMRRKKPRKK